MARIALRSLFPSPFLFLFMPERQMIGYAGVEGLSIQYILSGFLFLRVKRGEERKW